MLDPKYELALEKAFKELHHCAARHVRTVPVVKILQGKTVWKGDVEVFNLVGHPNTDTGYAWAHGRGKGWNIVVVLGIPPVVSPETAVHASIGKLPE